MSYIIQQLLCSGRKADNRILPQISAAYLHGDITLPHMDSIYFYTGRSGRQYHIETIIHQEHYRI